MKHKFLLLTAVLAALLTAIPSAHADRGLVSWYGDRENGRRTASGERFNKNAMTCAHRRLPFGTRLRLTIPSTGRTAECRVNDRGPFVGSRKVDMSEGMARVLDILNRGVVIAVIDDIGRARRGK